MTNYQSQEEHDHCEGAMEQGIPQEDMTPDKRVEEVQQSIKNLLYKAQEKNWKNGGVSIYDLSDLQEASDRVITQYHQDLMSEVVKERKDAYAHCAIIRERDINDILFEVADEARSSGGNGEKVIRKWMERNNCEIHPLLIED